MKLVVTTGIDFCDIQYHGSCVRRAERGSEFATLMVDDSSSPRIPVSSMPDGTSTHSERFVRRWVIINFSPHVIQERKAVQLPATRKE